MFFGLNACPSIYEKLYWKAIYGTDSSVETAMMVSNIMKKSKNEFTRGSLQIFDRISKVLGFQHISFKDNDNSGQNTEMTNYIQDIKGWYI